MVTEGVCYLHLVRHEWLLSPTSALYYCLSFSNQVNTITTVCVDLADLDATKKAVESLGPIHLLVNNAGVAVLQPFLDVTPETYDRLLCSFTPQYMTIGTCSHL